MKDSEYDFDPAKDVKKAKPWEQTIPKTTKHFDLDPESFGGEDFPSWEPSAAKSLPPLDLGPIVTPEIAADIKRFYDNNPHLKSNAAFEKENHEWIQTYSGRRFNPLNPYEGAIVLDDIAHSLSMQCRFSGHVKKFYSVAQHSVLVSYICDSADALWGLLHDASEAYLVDIPSPLKRSAAFAPYRELESNMQKMICKRFNLSEVEPPSVKIADKKLLATEARDLMGPLHRDWVQPTEPLPFRIEALPQQEAKDLFMKRFFELTNSSGGYEHYLRIENRA